MELQRNSKVLIPIIPIFLQNFSYLSSALAGDFFCSQICIVKRRMLTDRMTAQERPREQTDKAEWVITMNNTASLIQGGSTLLVINQADLREMFLSWVEEWQNTNREQEEKFLTRDEVCDKLNVTKPTLWRWKRSGYLVPIKVGSRPLYKQSDIDKLVNQEG